MPVVNGVTYNEHTSAEVIDALEKARNDHEPVRIFLGDAKTGEAWSESHFISGRIGTTSGKLRVPIMLANATSSGGAEILTHCVVAIRSSRTLPDKRAHDWWYRHPNFEPGVYVVLPAEETLGDVAYKFAALRDGVIVRHFVSEKNAERFVDFMTGKRGAP